MDPNMNMGQPSIPAEEPHEEHEHDDVEEMTTEELAESNNFVLSALIDLLVKKGLFTHEEFEQAMADLEESEDDDEDDDEDSEPSDPEQTNTDA